MLSGDIAKYQIQDRVRQAEAARLAGSVRANQVRRASTVRRVGSGLLAALTSVKPASSRTTVPQTKLA